MTRNSADIWYESKELIDLDDDYSGQNLFELATIENNFGLVLSKEKTFKPIHHSIGSLNEQELILTNTSHAKDQFADALLRLEDELELLDKRLKICESKLNELMNLSEREVKISCHSGLQYYICLLTWPTLLYFIIIKARRLAIVND